MAFLFDYHINYFSDSENKTNIPFSVFGMSQQGLSHVGSSIGNQDAGNIYVGRNIIIGAVADGCSSGNNLNGKSSNQVGANITSYLTVRLVRKLLLKNHHPFSSIINELEKSLVHHYKKVLNAINPWKFEKNRVITNFLASTFILFIVTQDEYIVLSCGDGDVFINGDYKNLAQAGGEYFSNNLIHENVVVFGSQSSPLNIEIHCIEHGQTKDLQSIFISTDGFLDRDIKESLDFSEFFFQVDQNILKAGVNDLKADFRKNLLDKILEEKDGRLWPLDDATFISLKRIKH